MLYWIRKLFNRMNREHDFEGRCEQCGRPLPLNLFVESNQKITLSVFPCPKHPEGGMILWPQRDDIRRVESIYTFESVDIPKGVKIEKATVILNRDGKMLRLDVKDKIEEALWKQGEK